MGVREVSKKTKLFDIGGSLGTNGQVGITTIDSNLSKESKRQTYGVGGYGGPDVSKSYDKTKNEKVYDGGFNSYLILGKDRHAGQYTGLGGLGGTNTGCLDLVAGLAGDKATLVDTEGNLKPYPKNFDKDSARVYITQKGSVDYYYDIPEKLSEARSAVTGKADIVRLIGRENIRLQTGLDSVNSREWTIESKSGVDILSGRDLDSLEPIVKGDKLVEFLKEQEAAIVDLHAAVFDLSKLVEKLMDELANHTHLSAFQTDVKSPKYNEKSIELTKFRITHNKDLRAIKGQIKKNTVSYKKAGKNYLTPLGKLFINSEYHKVN